MKELSELEHLTLDYIGSFKETAKIENFASSKIMEIVREVQGSWTCCQKTTGKIIERHQLESTNGN